MTSGFPACCRRLFLFFNWCCRDFPNSWLHQATQIVAELLWILLLFSHLFFWSYYRSSWIHQM